MVRSAGTLDEFTGQGVVASQYAAAPMDDGQAAQAAARFFSGLSGTLGALADQAAARDGALAGAATGDGGVGLPYVHFSDTPAPAGAAAAGGLASQQPAAATTAGGPAGRIAQARAFFLAKGYSPHQAAGIIGNLQQESSFAEDVIAGARSGDKGTAFGIGQWREGRQANFRAFANRMGKPATDFEAQLAFVDHELQTSESDVLKRLKAATTVDEATAAFIGYERPRGYSLANPRGGDAYDRRLKYAEAALGGAAEGVKELSGGRPGDLNRYLAPGVAAASVKNFNGEFANRMAAMLAEAPPGVSIYSGYRSIERQRELFQAAVKKYGSVAKARHWVAPPGKSQHNFGTAADLRFATPEAKAWVHANAARFGLNFRMSHENWHIEPLKGAAPAGVKGAMDGGQQPAAFTPAEPPPVTGIKMDVFVPEPKPLALRRDGTIYGDAYDKALLESAAWRFHAGLDAELTAAYDNHLDDPAAWEKARNEIARKYVAEGAKIGPEMKANLEARVADRAATFNQSIFSRREAKADAERKDAAGGAIAAAVTGIERQAYLIGTAKDGDQRLANLSAQALSSIDAAVASGALSPAEAASRRESVTTALVTSRIQGVFDALDGPAAKQHFAQGLAQAYADPNSPIASLAPDTFRQLQRGLLVQARQETATEKQANSLDRFKFERVLKDDLSSVETTGKGVEIGGKGLDVSEVAQIVGPEKAAKWYDERIAARAQFEALNGLDRLPPQLLDAEVAKLKPAPGADHFATRQKIYTEAVKRAKQARDAVNDDMLGHASRIGLQELPPLAYATPQELEASLAARVPIGEAVGRYYDRAPRFFTKSEAAAIGQHLHTHPDSLPAFAVSIVRSMQEHAPKALAEISKDAPLIAHAAGVAIETGDDRTLAETARALKMAAMPDYEPVKLPPAQKAGAARAFTSALQFLPGLSTAAQKQADLLFDGAARAAGIDPADTTQAEAAQAIYSEQLNRALGAHEVAGELRGGMGAINGHVTLLPPDMAASTVQYALEHLTDDMLAQLPPIYAVEGVTVKAADLRGARLVAAGPGKYALAAGDLTSEPMWLATPEGGQWLLDINQLVELVATAPAYDPYKDNPFDPNSVLKPGAFLERKVDAPPVQPGEVDMNDPNRDAMP
jgi:hypothetical protein